METTPPLRGKLTNHGVLNDSFRRRVEDLPPSEVRASVPGVEPVGAA